MRLRSAPRAAYPIGLCREREQDQRCEEFVDWQRPELRSSHSSDFAVRSKHPDSLTKLGTVTSARTSPLERTSSIISYFMASERGPPRTRFSMWTGSQSRVA